MKILMVASESQPLCKTGGLADVAYALSNELVKAGEEVFVAIPYYSLIKNTHSNLEIEMISSFVVPMSWRREIANVYKTSIKGITYLLFENRQYFERDSLYGYFDDGERFAFFTLAVKEFIKKMKLIPDTIHVHDWHPGMLFTLIREDEKANRMLKNTKFVLSIHNPAFQGLLDKMSLGNLYNLPDYLFDNGTLRFKDRVSTLKAGIVYADKISTVSPTHHLELLTSEGSMGLNDVLIYRQDDFNGILNGIDYDEFNPYKDRNIFKKFSKNSYLDGKKENKKQLFKKFNIKDYGFPCYALVSRLTWQKGLDILIPVAEELAYKGCNVFILGSGEEKYENAIQDLRNRYPDKVAFYRGYSDVLAHQIYASSDFFLMPSLFEPCGLGQMIAQRYGSLPIVRYTGGLKDSVIGFDGNNLNCANGFGFDIYSKDAMSSVCNYAFETYFNKEVFHKLIENAMNTNNSWKKSMNEYLNLYKSMR